MVTAAEMPNVASAPLGWLREEVKVGEVAVVLRAARFEQRRDDDGTLAQRVCGGAGSLLLCLASTTEGGEEANGEGETS
jgi:hypothetical protein